MNWALRFLGGKEERERDEVCREGKELADQQTRDAPKPGDK